LTSFTTLYYCFYNLLFSFNVIILFFTGFIAAVCILGVAVVGFAGLSYYMTHRAHHHKKEVKRMSVKMDIMSGSMRDLSQFSENKGLLSGQPQTSGGQKTRSKTKIAPPPPPSQNSENKGW